MDTNTTDTSKQFAFTPAHAGYGARIGVTLDVPIGVWSMLGRHSKWGGCDKVIDQWHFFEFSDEKFTACVVALVKDGFTPVKDW